MIRYFCDGCDQEVKNPQRPAVFEGQHKKMYFKINLGLVLDRGSYSMNDGHWCIGCVINAIVANDPRPKPVRPPIVFENRHGSITATIYEGAFESVDIQVHEGQKFTLIVRSKLGDDQRYITVELERKHLEMVGIIADYPNLPRPIGITDYSPNAKEEEIEGD